MRLNYVFISALLLMLFTTAAASSEGLDISRSVTIGSGPKVVFEFTDPDCPFCRKASKYFEGRNDVTRHVFFYPLPRHPKAKVKAQYILSQFDRAKAYHDIMSGRMDSAPSFETTPKGIKLQQDQWEIAKKAGVNSTPTFIINGRIVVGFDQKKIEEALGAR